MSYRGGNLGQLYIRPETKKLLWLIAKARGITADELGDTMLLEAIISKYPELSQYINKLEKLEQEMMLVVRK